MLTTRDTDEAKDLTCFVIGPIGDKDADAGSDERRAYEDAVQVLEEVVEPACAGFGIPVIRADRISKPGDVTEQIYRNLRDAHLVVADLTGANPNVMYELGLRHTTGKLTIQIGERGRLPFDVNVIRTILFKRTEGGLVEARRKLSAAIASGLADGGDPVTATRVWFESSVVHSPNVVTAVAEGELADDDALGFLEQIAEMSEAMDSASATLDAVTTVFNEIGELANAGAAELNAINASGGPASARVAVTNRLATSFDSPASKMEVLAGDYSRSVDRMDAGMRYLLTAARAAPDVEGASEFRENVGRMIVNAESTMQSIEQLRSETLAAGDATRSFRAVNRRIARSLTQILNTRSTFEAWKELL
ncbi:MAG TPA: hypothetical protein VKB93_22300 [Thermoanaerobaculia bacterium]|nr:hypothetical protein [Thermoanaerobaculia bacterium]